MTLQPDAKPPADSTRPPAQSARVRSTPAPAGSASGPVRAGALRFARGPWLPALVGLLCYLNTLPNGFVYDDVAMVRDNPRIASPLNFRDIWLTGWWDHAGERATLARPGQDRLYRPLTLFTFAINDALGGARPLGFHAVNVLLHAAACALLWMLAMRVFAMPRAATAAALLFAVHPAHAEAVASVVGRAELLAAALMLAGLIALLRRPERVSAVAVAAVAFFGALLSKETAICYPVVALLLLHWAVRGQRRPPGWWLVRVAVLLVPLVVYFPLRAYALDGRLLRSGATSVLLNPLMGGEITPVERVVGALTILGEYARLLLAPVRLASDYGMAVFDPHRGVTGMTLAGVLAAGALAAGLLGYASRKPLPRALALCAALFIASYALISNTVLLIGVSLAERLMYWPSVAFCLAVGVVVAHAAPDSPIRAARWMRIGVLALVALGVRTAMRNADWRDNRTLLEADVRTHPQSAQLSAALGGLLVHEAATTATYSPVREELLTRADRLLTSALQTMPRMPEAWRSRGELQALRGQLDAARASFEFALQLDPTRAVVRARLRDLERQAASAPSAPSPAATALEALRRAVAERPGDAQARLELGRALLASERGAEAVEPLRIAARLAPDDADVWLALAEALLATGLHDDAADALRALVRLRPDDWAAHTTLAGLLATSDPAGALAHAERAHALAPNDWRTKVNLGEALLLVDRRADGLRRLEEALRMLPAGHPARLALEARVREVRGE